MSTQITGEGLKELVREGVIEGGSEDRVEGIKYDVCFGGQFLKAKHGKPMELDDFERADTESVRVEPGETVFVLTQEILRLPSNIKAELSHKRKLAHTGIQVLGGFCVDPLYEGHLMFGLHNFSSEPFPLIKGKKIIAMQFYRLSEEECDEFPEPKGKIFKFPSDVNKAIGWFWGISNQALNEKVEHLTHVMSSLQEDFSKREKAFERLGGMIEEILSSVKQLGQALNKEKKEREAGQDRLTQALREMQKDATNLASQVNLHAFILRFVSVIVGGVVIVVLGYYAIQLLA